MCRIRDDWGEVSIVDESYIEVLQRNSSQVLGLQIETEDFYDDMKDGESLNIDIIMPL